MTAHELARKLLAGPDCPVHKSYPTGNYWWDQAAPLVTSIESGKVIDSAHLGMPKVVKQEDFERDERNGEADENKYRTVILID